MSDELMATVIATVLVKALDVVVYAAIWWTADIIAQKLVSAIFK